MAKHISRAAKRLNRSKYYSSDAKHAPPPPGSEILHEFVCKNCSRTVEIWEKNDRRSVFCCRQCERQWWRDETRHDNAVHKRGGNLGMSGGMSLNSLIRREAMDLY